jgi:23S rRNA (uracil-5-)-methyltransferase RumA
MVKKGEIIEIKIEDLKFPNRGQSILEDKKIIVHNTLPGQEVRVRIKKKRKSKVEATLLEIIAPAPNQVEAPCKVFGECGGCTYQNLSYEDQLELKEKFVKEILADYDIDEVFEGVLPSPKIFGYRNKMEFSFGDSYKDGPLELGLHKRGSMYDIVDASKCMLVDKDFNKVLSAVLSFARKRGYSYYHKRTHEGFLRHLVVRKGIKTRELLIELVTSSQGTLDEQGFLEAVKELDLDATVKSIIHTKNDSLSDVVQEDLSKVLFGQGFIYDEIKGLKFKITPRSFFQTNTLGAEVLYDKVSEYAGSDSAKQIFDLYCGTGTITQILAKNHEHVTGIEIVEDAVKAAVENAELNGVENARFICGDVMEEVSKLDSKPDVIILDPPRDGIHVKAIDKIIGFNPEVFVYVSCKPTSLARDLPSFLEAGYEIKKVCCVDMFSNTPHVETVVLMSRVEGK